MTKPIGLSRGPTIDTENCVKNVGGNRFNLVLIAAERAREIRRQNKDSDKREHVHSILTALTDIQEGRVNENYITKLKFKESKNRDHSARN
jgi:DNA-directed RNA polymerase omega subunit